MRAFETRIDPKTQERYLAVARRGTDLKTDPVLNKGTCFPIDERKLFGLEGLLPPQVSSPEGQQERAYNNYLASGDDIRRYVFLSALQDRNETLFYRLVLDHIDEMAPIVYTPTVGKACQQYSHLYRYPRGIYISPEHRGRMVDVLRGNAIDDCRIIVLTDNEAILGLGDLGVGGMGIPIGKLTLYTAGAGIHPATCLPIDLDIGTNNESLLEDPLYLGVRQKRLRGEPYLELLDELVDAIKEVYPHALVQWEDFAGANAFEILERYRHKVLSFDDDIQGTGAVVVAGILGALQQAGRSLRDERIVFLGAGASGGGCARSIRDAFKSEGVPDRDAAGRSVCIDSRGLILSNRPGLSGHKVDLAAAPDLVAGWDVSGETIGLLETVRNYKPTILLGMSGRPGSFTEEVVREMHRHCPRPVIFPLSNPTSLAEATPADLLRWTRGAALVATGSPFAPVDVEGQTYEIGQANNVLIFPGVGLGAVAVGAAHLPDVAFLAAAQALAEAAEVSTRPGAPIFPPLRSLRSISRIVGTAVARALVDADAAPPLSAEEIDERIAEFIWEPVYLPYRPAE
ncbi:MAG: NAD-dependent malic enzyme [Planctomycetota bacterium]|jgi:malate dehydrogenase (oxaloacetate-decarboxylating)